MGSCAGRLNRPCTTGISTAGHSRDTTPNLAAFAAMPGSINFSQAHTDASWSEPAYMSLFTELEAISHGVPCTLQRNKRPLLICPTTETTEG